MALDRLAAAWQTWQASHELANVRACAAAAQDAARSLGADPAARTALDPDALWSWLPDVLTTWTAYERGFRAGANGRAQEHRAAYADAVRATLGVLRNSVVFCAGAQEALVVHKEVFGGVLDYCLSFEQMADPTLVRVLAQVLVNATTENPKVQQALWRQYMVPPNGAASRQPSADAIVRLLASTDERTVLAAMVFVLNCLDGSSGPDDGVHPHKELAATPEGVRASEQLLAVFDAALVREDEEALETIEVLAAIFQRLLTRKVAGELLERLGGEELTSAQVALLRVLAVCMQERIAARKQVGSGHELPGPPQPEQWVEGSEPMLRLLVRLANDAADTMRRHVEAPGVAGELGGLVRAHLALVALLTFATYAAMCGQEDVAGSSSERAATGDQLLLERLRSADAQVVEAVVALLHQAIAFFPAQSPFAPGGGSAAPAPDGHVLSATGAAPTPPADRPALHSLKRSAVQLLGTLAHAPPNKPRPEAVVNVQDRVRESGGLYDVLNTTVLDETNPYVREHAIFALRALLHGNVASQELVAALKPMHPDDATGARMPQPEKQT